MCKGSRVVNASVSQIASRWTSKCRGLASKMLIAVVGSLKEKDGFLIFVNSLRSLHFDNRRQSFHLIAVWV